MVNLICIILLFYSTIISTTTPILFQTIITPIQSIIFAFDLLIRIVFDILILIRSMESSIILKQSQQTNDGCIFLINLFEPISSLLIPHITSAIILLGFPPIISQTQISFIELLIAITICAIGSSIVLTRTLSVGLSFLLIFDGIESHSTLIQAKTIELAISEGIKIILIAIINTLMLIANASLLNVNLCDLVSIQIVSTNFDIVEAITTSINSNSKYIATITNIRLIIIGIAIIVAITRLGEVALLLQQVYIMVFKQTVDSFATLVNFGIVMCHCCDYNASYFAIGSIFGDIVNEFRVTIRFGIIFNLFGCDFLDVKYWINSSNV